MSRRAPKTAGEFLDELERDPGYIERQKVIENKLAENRQRYQEAAKGLLAELSEAGFAVSAVAELRRQKARGQQLVPILVKWLYRVDYTPLKKDIIATLGSAWAKPAAAAPLIEAYWRTSNHEMPEDLRWEICDALDRTVTDRVVDDVIEITQDSTAGSQRGFAVAALGKLRKSAGKVEPVLLFLLRDESVALYAIIGLGRLRSPATRQHILPFVDHTEKSIRDEAKRALKKIPIE